MRRLALGMPSTSASAPYLTIPVAWRLNHRQILIPLIFIKVLDYVMQSSARHGGSQPEIHTCFT
jgi:hypothetical protein